MRCLAKPLVSVSAILQNAAQAADPRARDVEDHEILHVGGPERTRPVAIGQIGGGAHLAGRDPPAHDGEAGVEQARLLLGVDADMVAVDVFRRHLRGGGREGPAEPPFDLRAEALGRPAVLQEEELQSGLLPMLPQNVAVAEDF
jgi:hypothetical protein